MMDDFCKCLYCKNYDSFMGCGWGCEDYSDYRPNKNRILERAKELEISVADLLALIELEGEE